MVMIGTDGKYSYAQIIPTLPLPPEIIQLDRARPTIIKTSTTETTGPYNYSIRCREDIIEKYKYERYKNIDTDTLLGIILGTIGLATLFRLAKQTRNPYALMASAGMVAIYVATLYNTYRIVDEVTEEAIKTYNITDLQILINTLKSTLVLLTIYQLIAIHTILLSTFAGAMDGAVTLDMLYQQALAYAVLASLVSYIINMLGMPELAGLVTFLFGVATID